MGRWVVERDMMVLGQAEVIFGGATSFGVGQRLFWMSGVLGCAG